MIKIHKWTPFAILKRITTNFFYVTGSFIYSPDSSICMRPRKKKIPLPGCSSLVVAVILITCLLAAGCTGQAPEPGLNGTGWTLTGYVFNGTAVPVLTGTKVTLDFGDGGRITGTAGCNRYFASYEVKGTAITIGPAGSTMMYCGSPGVMARQRPSPSTVTGSAYQMRRAQGSSRLPRLFRLHRNHSLGQPGLLIPSTRQTQSHQLSLIQPSPPSSVMTGVSPAQPGATATSPSTM